MTALPTMAPALQSILDTELAAGNTIQSVGEWPPTCRLFVQLAHPFTRAYALEADITYRDLNDPHYWKAEYNFRDGLECLACGF